MKQLILLSKLTGQCKPRTSHVSSEAAAVKSWLKQAWNRREDILTDIIPTLHCSFNVCTYRLCHEDMQYISGALSSTHFLSQQLSDTQAANVYWQKMNGKYFDNQLIAQLYFKTKMPKLNWFQPPKMWVFLSLSRATGSLISPGVGQQSHTKMKNKTTDGPVLCDDVFFHIFWHVDSKTVNREEEICRWADHENTVSHLESCSTTERWLCKWYF